MKTIRFLTFIFSSLGLLLALAGCQAPTPLLAEPISIQEPAALPSTATPALPAPTSTVVALSEADLVEHTLAAVAALAQPDGFTYEAKVTSFTAIKLTAGGKTVNEGSSLVSLADQGAWLRQGERANIVLKRNVYFPGSNSYPLNGEMRLVDGQIYLRAAFNQPKPDLPAMPEGWVRVNGFSTLLYWPNTRDLNLEYSLREMRLDPWALLSSYPAEVLEEVLSNHLEAAQRETTELSDSSPVEVLTFTLKSSALMQTIYNLDRDDPGNERALSTVKGSPIRMKFTLDEAGRLVAWELSIRAEVKDVDFSGIPGAPDGARLEGKFEQTVSASLQRAPALTPVAAPTSVEIGKLPAYSGAAANLPFQSLDEFDVRLNEAISAGTLEAFWQALSSAKTMPLVFGDLAVFLYRGEAQSTEWIADWSYSRVTGTGRLEGSNVWMHTVRLPPDARLEYQIRLDGQELIVDPLNPEVEVGGLGSRSVVRMPGYVAPGFVLPQEGVSTGALTEDTPFPSRSLGYTVNYRVYTPAGYASLRRLPVLYVTDGQDFLAFGKLAAALDHLIAAGKIRPVIAVFIDPRDVKTGENQRDRQFFDNPQYGEFIAGELVPEIDRLFRTDPSPEARLIIGASNGGYHSIYFAQNHSDTFHLVCAFSPSLWHNPEIIDAYRQGEVLPLKFFISTGVFNDNDFHSRQFQEMLKGKGYPLLYIESNEGHSYGNWRGKFAEMLEFFFPVGISS
jgi:enterochelin esterase family protein